MNGLSLYSGIGGLDLGLERAGITVVGQVEIDPFCQRVLAKHWPEVPRHDDVRTCPEWWRSQPRPRVDLVCGGFPCQGHSVAGKQHGEEDERWGWPAFRDVINATNPPLVLIENVPNLTRTGLLTVLQDLADRGFDAWWFRVPAAAFGAPHLRWRLFTIAAHPQRIELRVEPWRSGWSSWPRTALIGFDGATWALADPDSKTGGPSARLAGPRSSAAEAGLGTQEPGRRIVSLGRGPWTAEPGVDRVAPRVPARVDRLKALGNAVVPQVAEYIGHLILAGIEETAA